MKFNLKSIFNNGSVSNKFSESLKEYNKSSKFDSARMTEIQSILASQNYNNL